MCWSLHCLDRTSGPYRGRVEDGRYHRHPFTGTGPPFEKAQNESSCRDSEPVSGPSKQRQRGRRMTRWTICKCHRSKLLKTLSVSSFNVPIPEPRVQTDPCTRVPQKFLGLRSPRSGGPHFVHRLCPISPKTTRHTDSRRVSPASDKGPEAPSKMVPRVSILAEVPFS